MTKKQKATINYLRENYPNDIVTLRENNDPNGKIIFRGTISELENYYKNS